MERKSKVIIHRTGIDKRHKDLIERIETLTKQQHMQIKLIPYKKELVMDIYQDGPLTPEQKLILEELDEILGEAAEREAVWTGFGE